MKYFLDKFKYAFRGLKKLVIDKSVIIQEVIAIFTLLIFKFILHANNSQMLLIVLCCAAVIVAEMINTCLEKILDFIEPNYNEKVKVIKDMGAGFVLFTALIAAVIGMILLIQIIGG